MKGFAIYLLTLALSWQTVWSLQCYFCPYVSPSSECSDTRNCSEKHTVCETKVYSPDVGFPFQGNEEVTRDCAVVCKASDVDELGVVHPILCCNIDLCNSRGLFVSGGVSEKNSYGLLICFICLVAALLKTEL
ncbi:ly6/PLAUR domain-containing protein 2-like [Ascaphus truei]|uniref:ly6/PLAUR domain-containing protein 2-like n=1 Tax=Ascaphus truei TaxID=8439 RepID=UPI003F5ACDD5